MKTFETIEHTADIGLRSFGRTIEEAFENAAYGMFSLITDLESVNQTNEFNIVVTADDEAEETLLVEWLNELLYLYDGGSLLLSRFRIDKIGEGRLEGSAFGEPLDLDRHSMRADIKAVTYHMLRLEKTEAGWTAEVIFDV